MLDSEQQQEGSASGEEIFYKTKVVQFLGRDTSIILQNDNGPCPLLAICNVLLLRNQLSLGLDVSEVSLQKLLSLVAERLIDFNSNVQDKDDGYVNNQQQNISDAIDLLPRLATGIDVNVHFRRIDDFEFTRECAIFDLLDIGLYHGWIVDPQDADTATAIGSKSYNTLVAELVQAFEAKNSDGDNMSGKEDDCVDFAAATTATLGVPSPSLPRGRSFDDQVSDPAQDNRRKGDIQEQVELMRALDISRAQVSTTTDASMSPTVDRSDSSLSLDENEDVQKSASGTIIDALDTQIGDESNKTCQSDMPVSQKCYASGVCKGDVLEEDIVLLPTTVSGNSTSLAFPDGSAICENSTKSEENISTAAVFSQVPTFQPPDGVSGRPHGLDLVTVSGSDQSIVEICSDDHAIPENPTVSLVADSLNTLQSSNGEVVTNASEVVTSSVQGTEPIYEGEECILRSGFPMCENVEPVYEGEMILAGKVDKTEEDSHSTNGKDKIAHEQWQLIKNFLERNASQLTIYGLFCLQEGLKERELCVFFRNNHFSTMFKLKGELYLLATDQGYMNQPDLVWEKLNEVNGDTVFMTGNFTQFKIDSQVHDSWNEQSAMNSTSDYLAALETSGHPSSAIKPLECIDYLISEWPRYVVSDLQLAIALQQQEFEQESQRAHQQHSQQSSIPGRSRLTTGPQVSRNSDVSQKSESKIKEKCIVM